MHVVFCSLLLLNNQFYCVPYNRHLHYATYSHIYVVALSNLQLYNYMYMYVTLYGFYCVWNVGMQVGKNGIVTIVQW